MFCLSLATYWTINTFARKCVEWNLIVSLWILLESNNSKRQVTRCIIILVISFVCFSQHLRTKHMNFGKKRSTAEYGTYIDINALLKTSERIGLITSQQFISPNQINKPYLLGFWQIVASAYDRYFPIILSWCSHLRRIHQALQDYCKISQWCNKENKTVYRFDRRLERSFYINGQSSVHYSNYGKKHFLLSSSFRKKSTSEYFCG